MVLVQDPFYRHDSLGPGAELRQITGASEQAGYYDWAGRRLFLADGEPDPMCPGAYRYQHNPDCCDPEAPDSDPRSPRYEPMHLRHKPGDTWIIDANRPYDPFDSGPYGCRGWYKDERTGRHRRDELPDPLPAEDWTPPKGAWFPGTADWPEPEAPLAESAGVLGWAGQRNDGRDNSGERRGKGPGKEPDEERGEGSGGAWPGSAGDRDDRGREGGVGGRVGSVEWLEGDGPNASGVRGGSDRPPPWGPRGRPVPSPEDDDEPGPGVRGDNDWPRAGERSGPHGSERRTPWGAREPEQHQGDREARPREDENGRTSHGGWGARRPWGHAEPDSRGPGDEGWISGYGVPQRSQGGQSDGGSGERGGWNDDDSSGEGGREREGGGRGRGGTDDSGEFRFSKLREDAFDRFMANSAQLRAAHFQPERPYLRERAVWVLRWLAWVFAIGLMPMPAPLSANKRRAGSTAAQPIPTQVIPAQRGPEHGPQVAEFPAGPAETNRPGSDRPGDDSRRADQSQAERPQPAGADRAPRPEPAPRPGAAIAAAVEGARAARKAIADRNARSSTDLAAAVRDSAAIHWRTRPCQDRPSPTPRPAPSPVSRSSVQPAPSRMPRRSVRPAARGSYMTAWEQAFDTGQTLILGTSGAFGAAA